MGISIDVDNYETPFDSLEDVYSEEVMYSGWNPAITLLCQQQLLVPTNRLATPPEGVGSGAGNDEPLLQLDSWGEAGYAH